MFSSIRAIYIYKNIYMYNNRYNPSGGLPGALVGERVVSLGILVFPVVFWESRFGVRAFLGPIEVAVGQRWNGLPHIHLSLPQLHFLLNESN